MPELPEVEAVRRLLERRAAGRSVRRVEGRWLPACAAELELPALRAMGPEPLGPEFTTGYLADRVRKRANPIKAFLLDQTNVAGLGNIYADESLHRARIHPERRTGSLT